ncbi:hypothetical protein LCGC14_2859540 [marine sediment metagenome]|uniref:Uncharacterized protein n=1 Tax=marine sediment metagenome TaxID=412755 RepID=A0A0F8YSS9_9ZZZZ
MTSLSWEKIAEIKHALAQERTIICGCIIRLEELKIAETVEKMRRCDQRLKELDCELVEIIEGANNNNS